MAACRGDVSNARKLCWACNGVERRGALLDAESSAREAGHDALAEELARFHASAVESPRYFDAPCSLTVDSLISISVVCDQGERDTRLLRYLLDAPSFTSEDAGRALVRAAEAYERACGRWASPSPARSPASFSCWASSRGVAAVMPPIRRKCRRHSRR